jgi:hypothetical protein
MIDQFEPDWSYVALNRNCVKMILWAHPTSKYPWHWLFTHQVCSLTLFIVSLWTERPDDMTLFVFVGCRGKCFVATSWKILMQHTEVMAARLPPCVIVSFEHMSLPGSASLPPQVSFFYLSFHIWTLYSHTAVHVTEMLQVKFVFSVTFEFLRVVCLPRCIKHASVKCYWCGEVRHRVKATGLYLKPIGLTHCTLVFPQETHTPWLPTNPWTQTHMYQQTSSLTNMRYWEWCGVFFWIIESA